MLKRRQLGALGWRLVAVPFFEWDFRPAAETDAYLKAMLADARGESAAPAAAAPPSLAALSYPQL